MDILFTDVIKLLNFLFIPLMISMWKYSKKQMVIGRDINDLKIYMKKVCEKLDVTCILKEE